MERMPKYTLVLMLLALSTASCGELLAPEPTSTITVNSFWNTPADARGGLYGMYERFRGQASRNLYIWGAARSEEMSYGLQASQGLERYFLNTLNADFAGPSWLRLYTVIHDANLILKHVPNIAFSDEAEKNSILAQALTMRAYVYFIIAKTWGDAPLITEPTQGFDPQTTFKERDDVSKIFDQIKADLEKALSLYPDNDFVECRCQWSKPSTQAVKGDVYLWTAKVMGGGAADLKTALNALQEIQDADVRLLEDFADVFRYDNKGNEEILMAVHFEQLEASGTWNSGMYIIDFQILDNLNEEAKELLGVGGGLNRWGPSETLRSQFTKDDSRKEVTFAEAYEIDESGDSSFYASAVLKFNGIVTGGSRVFADDVILYRYADVLLMIAEAKNALGMDPSREINMVRRRAYGEHFPEHKFVSTTGEANNEAILQERLRELAFEGKRWWDLVRFGKVFELVPSLQGRADQEYLLLWPIPQSVISLNSSIEQNPGY